MRVISPPGRAGRRVRRGAQFRPSELSRRHGSVGSGLSNCHEWRSGVSSAATGRGVHLGRDGGDGAEEVEDSAGRGCGGRCGVVVGWCVHRVNVHIGSAAGAGEDQALRGGRAEAGMAAVLDRLLPEAALDIGGVRVALGDSRSESKRSSSMGMAAARSLRASASTLAALAGAERLRDNSVSYGQGGGGAVSARASGSVCGGRQAGKRRPWPGRW